MASTNWSNWNEVLQAFARGDINATEARDGLDLTFGPNWGTNIAMAEAFNQAEAARNTARPASQPALNDADIVNKYLSGQYGAPGTTAARDKAIVELSRIYISQGRSQDEAFNTATNLLNKYVSPAPGTGTGTGAGTGAGGPATGAPGSAYQQPLTAVPDEAGILERGESATEAGRANIFARALAQRISSQTPPLVRRVLEKQAAPLEDIFLLEQGIGKAPASRTYNQFLANRSLGEVAPAIYKDILGQTRAFLNQAPSTGETDTQASFRRTLGGDQARQFQLALREAQMGVPRELQRGLGEVAGETFNQFALGQGLGAAGYGNNFLGYASPEKGGLGARFNPDAFRELLTKASGLIGAPEANLGSQEREFRQRLLDDPEGQFAYALQAELPSLPFEARPGFRRLAEDEFRRFQAARGVGTPFLPSFVGRGFSFFPRR